MTPETAEQIIEALRRHVDTRHAETQRTLADIQRRLDAVELSHAPGPAPTRQFMRSSRLRATPP